MAGIVCFTMGRIRELFACGLLIVLAAAACDGGSPTLQLATGPVSEDNFRTQVRQTAFVQPGTFEVACGYFHPSANPHPEPEFLETFQRAINPFGSQTPVATPVVEDELRAVEIIGEECEDLT